MEYESKTQYPGQWILMYVLFRLLEKGENQWKMKSRKKRMETAYYLAIALVVTMAVDISLANKSY